MVEGEEELNGQAAEVVGEEGRRCGLEARAEVVAEEERREQPGCGREGEGEEGEERLASVMAEQAAQAEEEEGRESAWRRRGDCPPPARLVGVLAGHAVVRQGVASAEMSEEGAVRASAWVAQESVGRQSSQEPGC